MTPTTDQPRPTQSPTAFPAPRLEAPRTLSTLNDDGSRRWLQPRVSRGRFLTGRRIVAYALIAIFTLIPYLSLNGKPLVLLDLTTRRFTIFGATFLPTDTLLLGLLLVGVFLSIFFITALFGRVWCGWACPQTVYMEFVFRPLERLFDGAPGRAKKTWLVRSGAGKVLKPAAYFLVSCYLAHTFLAYFVGVDRLRVWVMQSPLEHPTPFLVMATVTALMLFDFSYFREQMCLVACPYGRLQSALLDRQSLIIGYDAARGEPRGRAKRGAVAVSLPVISGEAAGAAARTGDCVDCGMCVVTCPTGIDIRNGLQMECIGCAQCVDACDAVMTKIGRPRGLIRYSSQARLAGDRSRLARARTIAYPLLIAVVAAGFLLVLLSRQPADITVLRGLGRPYTMLADGSVENHLRVKIINREEAEQSFAISAAAPTGRPDGHTLRLSAEENPVRLRAGESRTVPAMIIAPAGAFAGGTFDAVVRIDNGRGFVRDIRHRMQGPASSASP